VALITLEKLLNGGYPIERDELDLFEWLAVIVIREEREGAEKGAWQNELKSTLPPKT
jgi:hypothetical protein